MRVHVKDNKVDTRYISFSWAGAVQPHDQPWFAAVVHVRRTGSSSVSAGLQDNRDNASCEQLTKPTLFFMNAHLQLTRELDSLVSPVTVLGRPAANMLA